MRVLLIDGREAYDGVPVVDPIRAWVPAWSGGTRKDPGQAVGWAGFLGDGRLRHMQRPHAEFATTHLAHSDMGILGHPITELGRPGILLERARTQILASGNWNLGSWTATNTTTASAAASIFGPADSGQMWSLTSTSNGGKIALAAVTVSNMNANTLVFSIWVKWVSGATTLRLAIKDNGGATTSTKDWTLDTDGSWRQVWVTSPNVNSTSAQLEVYPGGAAGQANVFAFGPMLENTGASAATAHRGRGSLVDGGGARVRSVLDGPFVWPAAPWTLFCQFQALWGVEDGLAHRIFEAYNSASTPIYALTKSTGSTLQALVRDRRAGNQVAFTTPDATAYAHEADWRVVVKLSAEGALSGWLGGVEFDTQIAAPAALADANRPRHLILGDASATGSEADVLVNRLEIFDEDIEAGAFF